MIATRSNDEVTHALADGWAVVALESTIFSNLGLPTPDNLVAYERCTAAIRAVGAVPALTCVLDGVPRAGIDEGDLERVLLGDTKVAAKDLPVAIGKRFGVGVTTVSASMAIAASVGIKVFATGGIGGVHRGSELTGDISSDLTALATYPVACVSAGAKAFLDLARTLEYLETLGVPVIGVGTDRFPAFYTRDSGLPVPHTVEGPEQAAEILAALPSIGHSGGVLFAVPIPEAAELDAERLDAALQQALDDADGADLTGPEVTPFVLGRIFEATDGQSIPANLALAENNAAVAARIAVSLATR
ncbi:MAG: pseudouridine-5'-phosphate glycosidase [Actinomycetia bacterium]|nr:pseudouridine-5'-phosphate glycosidase [Actinomycetes bacterium]